MFTHTLHAIFDQNEGDVFDSYRCTTIIPPAEIAKKVLGKYPNAELISLFIWDDKTGEGRVYFPQGTVIEPNVQNLR